MAKRPTGQQSHSWAIYLIKGTKFIGLIHDAPDEQTAIERDQEISGATERARPADGAAPGSRRAH